MSSQTLHPALDEVLERHGMTLEELRFISERPSLHLSRDPIIMRVRARDGDYDERKHRDPIKFEDGAYPTGSRTLTEEEAVDLVTSPFFGENPRCAPGKALFRVLPKPPKAPKSQEEIIEERAQQLADERARELEDRYRKMLADRGIELPDEGEEIAPGQPAVDDVDVEPSQAPAPEEMKVITGVTNKQEALEALAKAGVKREHLNARDSKEEIVAIAEAHGIILEGY